MLGLLKGLYNDFNPCSYYYSYNFSTVFHFSIEKPKVKLSVEVEEDEPFVPSLLNSTVYIISMALQVSTFAINYRVSNYIFIITMLLVTSKTKCNFEKKRNFSFSENISLSRILSCKYKKLFIYFT